MWPPRTGCGSGRGLARRRAGQRGTHTTFPLHEVAGLRRRSVGGKVVCVPSASSMSGGGKPQGDEPGGSSPSSPSNPRARISSVPASGCGYAIPACQLSGDISHFPNGDPSAIVRASSTAQSRSANRDQSGDIRICRHSRAAPRRGQRPGSCHALARAQTRRREVRGMGFTTDGGTLADLAKQAMIGLRSQFARADRRQTAVGKITETIDARAS